MFGPFTANGYGLGADGVLDFIHEHTNFLEASI